MVNGGSGVPAGIPLVKVADVKAVRGLWTRVRDAYSARSLELTSPTAPLTLGGGISVPTRAIIAASAVAIASALAVAAGGPFGVIFFFPALAIAGIFGGFFLSLAAFTVTVVLIQFLFPEVPALLLDIGAALQVGLAMLGRVFFRESRRWGVRHRRLLGAVSAATTISDPQGRIERPHPDLGRLIGMDWPDYAGTGWLSAIHPDDVAKMIPAVPGNNGNPQHAETRLKDPATGDWRWYYMRAVPLFDDAGNVVEWISTLTDIHQNKMADEHQQMVIGEARHRLKNLITIIEALAKSSRPANEPVVDTFLKKFSGRLHALSAAGDLALASNFAAIDVGEIVRASLAPFLETESDRLTYAGPKLALSEATGGALALGLHELSTNAIKYGALSVPDGRVSFVWRAEPQGDNETVVMEWIETGRPNGAAPEREGFGGRLIRFIPSREKNGKVDIEYRPDGFYCRVSFIRAVKSA